MSGNRGPYGFNTIELVQ